MSGARFTPGPWVADRLTVVCANGSLVAEVHEDYFTHTKEDQANARLIAAAPDHALVARALAARVARWELFTNAEQSGELCIGGMRYVTQLDEFGVPELSDHTRHALAAGTGSAS